MIGEVIAGTNCRASPVRPSQHHVGHAVIVEVAEADHLPIRTDRHNAAEPVATGCDAHGDRSAPRSDQAIGGSGLRARERCAGSSGDLLPPLPPAEKATAHQDQTGKASTGRIISPSPNVRRLNAKRANRSAGTELRIHNAAAQRRIVSVTGFGRVPGNLHGPSMG
jgi:hypothetical protein